MKRKMNALIWSLCAVVALGGCAVSKKSDTGNADMVMKDDAGETVDPAVHPTQQIPQMPAI